MKEGRTPKRTIDEIGQNQLKGGRGGKTSKKNNSLFVFSKNHQNWSVRIRWPNYDILLINLVFFLEKGYI